MEIDRQYYCDVSPWTMDGQQVSVVEDNDHLGLVISGNKQIQKNIDLRIEKGRKSLFSLLGPAYSYKCLLSPSVKLFLYRTYTSPILRSWLPSLAFSKNQLEPLAIFQRKVIKSCLHLSLTAPTPSIHFITGELPVEGLIHQDTFSLFYNVWTNPNTKIYSVIKYLLESSNDNSRTWAIHVRYLSKLYNIEDPLICRNKSPPKKETYKEYIKTKISAFQESELRTLASTNSKMKYFNVSLLGLRGRLHPAICNVVTARQVKQMWPLGGGKIHWHKIFIWHPIFSHSPGIYGSNETFPMNLKL